MKMTVRKKLFWATGVVFILVIIVSLVGIWSIWRVGMGISLVEDHCTINRCWNADTIKDIKASFEKVIAPVHEFLETGNRECAAQFERANELLRKNLEDAFKMAASLHEPQFILLNNSLKNIQKEILEIKSLVGQIFAKPDFLGDVAKTVIRGIDIKSDSLPGQDAELVRQKVDIISLGVRNQLDSLLNFYAEDTKATLEKANKLRFNFAAIMVLIFFLLALAILGSGFLMARELTTPIQKLVQATQRVASGELTYKVPVSSSDEIGELAKCFNAMTDDLHKYQNKLLANERLATLGTFVSYMSHELRNPLCVLINCLFLLENQLKDEASGFQKYFKTMREEINRAKKIIDDCLNFSKDRKLELKETDLNELIEKILSLIEIPNYIQIKKDFCIDLPSIMVDNNQIHQVFTNIITNALMAMYNQGELKIITSKGENYDEIIFTDSGPGISEQNLKKLFDPFFTTKTQGTGLGLAICKYIVESHGGFIWAENSLDGHGASFYVRLPLEPMKKLINHHQAEAMEPCKQC